MSRTAIAKIINSSIEEINVTYSAFSSVSAVFISNPNQTTNDSKQKLLPTDAPITGHFTKLAAVTAAAAGILTTMHALLPSVHLQSAANIQSPTLVLQNEKKSTSYEYQTQHLMKSVSSNRTIPLEEPIQDSVEMIQLRQERHHLLMTSLRAESIQTQAKASTSDARIENPAANSEEYQRFADLIAAKALQYRGIPFVWGGTKPSGFDCSGFVQYVFKQLGIQVPRMSYDQAESGFPISYSQLQKGDLVFFQTDQAGASHVGIYLGDHQFVHADATRGITVAWLTNPYWNSRFFTARRLNK